VSPPVSICIPTYNGARYIAETLDSVIAQDHRDFEIVVGDDGSSDGTLDIVLRYDDPRIRVLPDVSGRGAAANFNRVVRACRAPYVKLVCQDDRLYPDCLSRQLAVLHEHSEEGIALVSSRRDIVDDHDRVVYPSRGWKHASGLVDTRRALRVIVRSGTNIIGEPSAVTFSKAIFERVGGFDEDQRYMVDLDLWTRMLTCGRLAFVPDALCTFRVSATSWSSQLARSQACEARKTLRSIRAAHAHEVRAFDLAIGYGKPTALAVARRIFFRMSGHLPERHGHEAQPSRDGPTDTADVQYAARLAALQQVWWKRLLPVQAPYRWNLRRLDLGFTLEIGCGIGRNLEHLGGNAIGIDHNEEAVRIARASGLRAFTSEEFDGSPFAMPRSFDTVLCSHVLEHMKRHDAVALLEQYLPLLRPGGTVVLIVPQERGFASDASHVEFIDEAGLREIAADLGLSVQRGFSFPFPRALGRAFVYNESVLLATT
jgi:GT2 family glycosyltransferase